MNDHLKMSDIRVIRSRRKGMSIEVNPQGVTVRASYHVSDAEIEKAIREKRPWIEKSLEKVRRSVEASELAGKLTEEELKELRARAKRVIPERVSHYAAIAGVSYGKITIRTQRKRWGSCSRNGNLSFNCLLMLMPGEVLDSVVVHELCHRKEMNHSAAFYREVRRVYPDYDRWNAWLKQNGTALLLRLPEK